MTEMAISNYLGIFIVVLLSYPFVLVVVNIAIFSKDARAKYTRWLNIVFAVSMLALLYFHMQTEVIFGKELLDQWYSNHPE
ncbi:hypothetical protein ACQKP8_12540 [Photobacterium alginatilyticum]|uniref:hypothetical protein n=1 Tax=Photobacterium alginatilyticum TaxID=1775171 RepID=UPI0040688AD5